MTRHDVGLFLPATVGDNIVDKVCGELERFSRRRVRWEKDTDGCWTANIAVNSDELRELKKFCMKHPYLSIDRIDGLYM